MYRFSWRTLGVAFLMVPFLGCSSNRYNVELVFDGLITVAREQKGKPGVAWVLVGNASEPKKLLVGQDIPPHVSHLLVRVKDEDGNVEAHASGTVSGQPLQESTTLKQSLELPGEWQEVRLTGEDLRIDANTTTKFKLPFGKLRRTQPCDPNKLLCWKNRSIRQRNNLGWTVDLDDALASLPGTADEKRVKSCLTEVPYSCQDSPILLNARLKLDKAQIFVSQLFGQQRDVLGGDLPHFTLQANGRSVTQARAQAQLVAARFIVSDPIKIKSRRLDGSGAEEILVIRGEPGKTVEVRLANHPGTCPNPIGCPGNDFLFNFNLLNNPQFIGVNQLPVPDQVTMLDGTAFNSQCSPSSYRP